MHGVITLKFIGGLKLLRIRNEREMQSFREQRALISVFVHHAYRLDLIKTVMGMKRGFDAHVGSAWHMLIPSVAGDYAIDAELSSEDYGIEYARAIIGRYGIKHGELPAIIFEFVPNGEFFCAKLGNKSVDEIEEIVGTIGDIAVDEFKNGPEDVGDFRDRVHQRIAIYLNQRKAIAILSAAAPKLTAFIGAASDTKSIFT